MPVLGHLNRHLGFALWVLILSLLSVSPAYGQVALTTPKDAGSTVEAVKPAATAAPKVEAPKVQAPKATAPAPEAAPKVEAAPEVEAAKAEGPKPPAPAAPKGQASKVEAPKVRAPKVGAPKVADDAVEHQAGGVAGRAAELQAAATKPVARARQRLDTATSTTAGAVTGLAERQRLVRTATARVEETRRTVDAVLGSGGGGDLFGGSGTGNALASIEQTLATLVLNASLVMVRETLDLESVSALGGSTAGGPGKADAHGVRGHAAPAALSAAVAGGSAPTTLAASTSRGGEPSTARGSSREYDFAALEMPGSLGALLGGEKLAGSAASTLPAAPERGPGPAELPALGTSAAQGFGFAALLAILSLFVFAARSGGRVFRIPAAWCRARGFPSLIELPG